MGSSEREMTNITVGVVTYLNEVFGPELYLASVKTRRLMKNDDEYDDTERQ
jgi:hypothetical protein